MVTHRSAIILLKGFLIFGSQLITLYAYAAGTCLSDKSDISEDMNKIHERLAIKYSNSDPLKVAQNTKIINQIYDEQQLKVDRSDPFLKQVNAVGVITDAPLGAQKGYATAVLISPCHVLVNAHAVENADAKQGKAPVYISLGQNTCNLENEFAHQNMPGIVIAIGDDVLDSESISSSRDYAVVKVPQVSDIIAPDVSIEFISIADSLATVGFPYSHTYTKKTGLRYPTLNFTRKIAVGIDGTFKVLNKDKLPGASGSGMFVLDKNGQGYAQMVLGGIFVGHRKDESGDTGLFTAAILQHLKATNLKTYNEVKTAIQTNACN